ncbi:GPCR fungal pheromone mating factor [Amylostereum chailletii]|nr:GPCR fungal pheromone mating factor [Amylostereum chailletii]
MDPTYPLVPVVSFIAASLVLLTVLTSVRRRWNVGVLMLNMWLFLLNLIQGFETIIWSDNARNRSPVWCDISSHFELASSVGIPACSLVITRRLCTIASMRLIDAPNRREVSYIFQTMSVLITLPITQRHAQCFMDFFIGIGFPILVTGPFYYVVQKYRFAVIEEIGCSSTPLSSGLTTILVTMWPVILPLLSALFYCPRIVWKFYCQRRDLDAFFRNNGSLDRTRYFRVLAVGCLDILFTLPTRALLLFLQVAQGVSLGQYPFYPGWHFTHHSWAPVSLPAAYWRSDFWTCFSVIF